MQKQNILNFIILILFSAVLGCDSDDSDKETPARDGKWRAVVYNIQNSKLPDNQVTAIEAAKEGVIWIGTAKGLVKIKNTEWTVFNTANSLLPSDHIRALATEANGKLWIGTDRGLLSYNGSKWNFYTTANSVITDDSIFCISNDEKNKRIWIATENELIKIDSATGLWERFGGFEDNLILSMDVAPDGTIWMGLFNHFAFRGRIVKFDGQFAETFQLDHLGYPSTFPYSLSVSSNNEVSAVLTGTSVKALIRIEAGAVSELPLPVDLTGIKSLHQDGQNLWIGGSTLAVYNGQAVELITIPIDDSTITVIASGKNNSKWLGTVNKGLVILRKN